MTTPPPPPPSDLPPTSGGAGSGDDKTMALIAHFGIILFGFIPPLIIYLIKGDSPWAKREAAKAFNFTIIFTALFFVLGILNVVLGTIDSTGFIGLASSCITCLLFPAAWIANLVFGIMNGMKANNGEETKYPFEIPILK
ncbi:MAG: DUF4870 domain-containing protein [Acidimicrobiia bacterium]